ncbi:MAG: hypothetical protein DWQ31_17745 [Planctomycetota bacterium]|nr:MAG: hypothetical protein DWQ31_17745 [Planctomycetota bacterium]REJ96818.1 MAG: hypothetical protein DWQ35_03385 [Planctomycetota bacterium]
MKVVFDIKSSRIAIEGDGPELLKVLQVAREVMPHVSQIQITADSEESEESESAAETPTYHQAVESQSRQTMRQFARSLSLTNVAERIAALAYYSQKIEGKPTCSPKEMDGWFTMCGFQKPSQMPVALYDTKRKYGYAENVGRGRWRISNQGENLIIRKLEERDDKS